MDDWIYTCLLYLLLGIIGAAVVDLGTGTKDN